MPQGLSNEVLFDFIPQGVLELQAVKLKKLLDFSLFTVVIRTNRISSCLDTNNPKMNDTSYESPECKV